MAAVLACGRGALLSHSTGAQLWDLAKAAGPPHVTVSRGAESRPGIVVHRTRALHPDDLARREGIRVTSVARTLVDLAEMLDRGRLERAFEAAERLRLLDLRAVEATCARARGRRGLKLLLALLPDLRPAPATRSELERRFVEICRRARLPAPALNALIAGFEVDACWPAQRLVVELDGWAYHRTRASFERDRGRDLGLKLGGYELLRVTWRMLEDEPERVVATLRQLLKARAYY